MTREYEILSLMKIAVIDDEPDICFILGFEIRSMGHEVIEFPNAVEAQKYFENGTADLIICDFLMPKLNGIEFFKWLNDKQINIPFFILTGETQMEPAEVLRRGINGILFKPQDLRKIEEVISNISRNSISQQ